MQCPNPALAGTAVTDGQTYYSYGLDLSPYPGNPRRGNRMPAGGHYQGGRGVVGPPGTCNAYTQSSSSGFGFTRALPG